jgi:hypothetical protein
MCNVCHQFEKWLLENWNFLTLKFTARPSVLSCICICMLWIYNPLFQVCSISAVLRLSATTVDSCVSPLLNSKLTLSVKYRKEKWLITDGILFFILLYRVPAMVYDIWSYRLSALFPSYVFKCIALCSGHRIGSCLQDCFFLTNFHYIIIIYTVIKPVTDFMYLTLSEIFLTTFSKLPLEYFFSQIWRLFGFNYSVNNYQVVTDVFDETSLKMVTDLVLETYCNIFEYIHWNKSKKVLVL